ncbi:hypothetical protein [Desulfoscipio geothermicus]|uniref:Uncharacterized protein n=1 Tax=Desulfoscipio geothermicus DSM 3669 TaxID=1121426 RepID=A0A1I6DR28_9FIRM|nr:hypothetical protein [Desulfoscipio geothermicus]SFR07899.1 hypothetical protein SAMN05660706_11572 [Desulfoscipio geothermicus DSM 3669]
MTDKEFVTTFVRQKERFIEQSMPERINLRTLDLFEKWLKEKLKSRKTAGKAHNETKKLDLRDLLDRAVMKAGYLLQDRGIQINCVSFMIPGNKTSSRCIKVHPHENLYYRICKTSPRKGKHKGQNLIAIELVMDGKKNNIFIPLLARKENMEKQLGMVLERERQSIEATGKYRFKIFFNLDEYAEKEMAEQLGATLADFITVTGMHLKEIHN